MSNIIPFPARQSARRIDIIEIQKPRVRVPVATNRGLAEMASAMVQGFGIGDTVSFQCKHGAVKGIVIDVDYHITGVRYRVDNSYTSLWLAPGELVMVRPAQRLYFNGELN